MNVLFLVLVVSIGYILTYQLYGRFIGKKIFALSRKNICPSVKFNDGKDYTPSRKIVVFGFHFTAIAGIGPIVGPAIGIIWGWIPALLWIFFGSIFVGAVHDFGALIVSMRNEGKSVFDYTSKYLNKRVRLILFSMIFFALLLIIAVFGLIISIIFTQYPQAVIPVWSQIGIAFLFWYLLEVQKLKFFVASLVGIIFLYLTIIVGSRYPLWMPSFCGLSPTGVWTIILLSYGYVASVAPVTKLIQPRGYLNTYQLIFTKLLIVIGIFVSSSTGSLEMVAPAVVEKPKGAPPMFPFLFVMIACGAISGFHSLVSSGASSKQISSEPDALFIG